MSRGTRWKKWEWQWGDALVYRRLGLYPNKDRLVGPGELMLLVGTETLRIEPGPSHSQFGELPAEESSPATCKENIEHYVFVRESCSGDRETISLTEKRIRVMMDEGWEPCRLLDHLGAERAERS